MILRYEKEHKKNADFLFHNKSTKIKFHQSKIMKSNPKNSKESPDTVIGIYDLNTNLYYKKAKCDLYLNYNGFVSTNNKVRLGYNENYLFKSTNYVWLPFFPLIFKYRRERYNKYEFRINKILSYPYYYSYGSFDIIRNALRLYISTKNRLMELSLGYGKDFFKYDLRLNSRFMGVEFRYKILNNRLVRSRFALSSNTKFCTLTTLADYKTMNFSTKFTKNINDNFKVGSEYVYKNGEKALILGYCLKSIKNIYSWFFTTNLSSGFSISRCFEGGKSIELGLVSDLAKKSISKFILQIRLDNPNFV